MMRWLLPLLPLLRRWQRGLDLGLGRDGLRLTLSFLRI